MSAHFRDLISILSFALYFRTALALAARPLGVLAYLCCLVMVLLRSPCYSFSPMKSLLE